MVEKNKVSIEEFIKIANVKKETIKKNRNKIPGLTYENGEFDIVKGTRYPGDYHRYKLKNSADRRYLLLKAISEYKYIDHIPLQVYPEQFKELLKELLDAKLIKENHLYNNFGANAYDCTRKGDALLRKEKNRAVRELAEMVAKAAGCFIGSVISEVFKGNG